VDLDLGGGQQLDDGGQFGLRLIDHDMEPIAKNGHAPSIDLGF
jgi:hypothetical protein